MKCVKCKSNNKFKTVCCTGGHLFCEECSFQMKQGKCPVCRAENDAMIDVTRRKNYVLQLSVPSRDILQLSDTDSMLSQECSLTNEKPGKIQTPDKCLTRSDSTELLDECNADELRQKLRHKFVDNLMDTRSILTNSPTNQTSTFSKIPVSKKTCTANKNNARLIQEKMLKEQILNQVHSHFKNHDDFLIADKSSKDSKIENTNLYPIDTKNIKFIKTDDSSKHQSTPSCHLQSKSESPKSYSKPLFPRSKSSIPPNKNNKCEPVAAQDIRMNRYQNFDSEPTEPFDTKSVQSYAELLSERSEMDPQSFVEFIKHKFNNMSLTRIKHIISELPNMNITPANVDVEKPISPRKDNIRKDEVSAVRNKVSTIARRAFINSRLTSRNEPDNQHSPIEPFHELAPYSMIPDGALNHIPRSPIICPISTCTGCSVFVSEFAKHIRMNHVRVPAEVLRPEHGTNMFVDLTLDELNETQCRMLYLVTDKIKNLGSSQYKHYLPILLMTTRVNMKQMLFPKSWVNSNENDSSTDNYCSLIWLTGLQPSDQHIHYTLTAWQRKENVPSTHLVHSGNVYSIRSGQQANEVYLSGEGMMLTHRQIINLSDGEPHLVKIQVVIY